MNKTGKMLLALLLCICQLATFGLWTIPAFAESQSDGIILPSLPEEDDAKTAIEDLETETGKTVDSNQNAATGKQPDRQDGVLLPPLPETNDDTSPIPSSNNSENNSIGSYGGYSSPIVNIESIAVPLSDGFSVVLPFLDVPVDAYYTTAVAWAYSHEPQVTAGVTYDRFDPLATCTRGQMVTFLWRAAGCPEPKGDASRFVDVAADAYYAKAVAWAVENGITTGMGDGKFDPNGIVNRAQTVTFLYRAKGKPAVASAAQFTDVAAGEYYADAVAWAVANEITNGMGDGSFAPANNCVRGQTVTFLYRAYK